MLRRAAACLVFVLALCTTATPASAHASLESTEPRSGAVLDEAPTEVTLRFTESVEVDDGDVTVVDTERERVDKGVATQPDGRTVVVPLDEIGDGGYVVAWRVVSSDGHPIGGGFTFRVGDSAAVDPSLVEDLLDERRPSRASGVVYGIGRFMAFSGAIVLIGAAAFLAALWPTGVGRRRSHEILWLAWVLVLAGTVSVLGSQWSQVKGLDTTTGQAWVARLALLLPAAALIVRPRVTAAWWRVAGGVTSLAILITFAASGHADSGRWVPLSQVADVVHLGAASVWIGGLAMLVAVALRNPEPDARAVTARFSTLALVSVGVVVATGSFQSVRQVQSLDGLETAYGRLLAVKVVIVLVVIGVASLTRSAVRGRLPVDGQPARVLRRLVAVEVALAVAVIGVTALLVDANPTVAATSGEPFDETRVVDDVLVNVVVVPGAVGPTDIHLYVDDPGGGLEPPLEASATLALGSAGVDGIPVSFVPAGPGHWSAYDVDVPLAGDWTLTIEVLLTEFDNISTTFTVPIGGST